MRKLTLLILVVVCQIATAGQNEKKRHELNEWNPLNAEYKIHSGNTAYSEIPTKKDSAMTVAFDNESARQLFDQIGPDKACLRRREWLPGAAKKGAFCSYTARLENPKNAHYRCWIGIDLRTGEGDVRVPC